MPFWHERASLKREWNERFKGPRVPKKNPDLHTNELNTTFFCSTSPLKAINRLKSLKLAWRFVLTSCDIYQNPFTQENILKFWQVTSVKCRTKNIFYFCCWFKTKFKLQRGFVAAWIKRTFRQHYGQHINKGVPFHWYGWLQKKKTGTVRKSSVRFY
jgi:hypothetical protein